MKLSLLPVVLSLLISAGCIAPEQLKSPERPTSPETQSEPQMVTTFGKGWSVSLPSEWKASSSKLEFAARSPEGVKPMYAVVVMKIPNVDKTMFSDSFTVAFVERLEIEVLASTLLKSDNWSERVRLSLLTKDKITMMLLATSSGDTGWAVLCEGDDVDRSKIIDKCLPVVTSFQFQN